MPHENCRKAATLFSSRPSVPRSGSTPPIRRTFGRKVAGVRMAKSCASLHGPAGAARPDAHLARCCHKACVFPAQPGARGECVYHHRQYVEPGCFQSLQPSSLLLDQAKFGLPDTEPDDGRVQDRNRLAAERVRFMLAETA